MAVTSVGTTTYQYAGNEATITNAENKKRKYAYNEFGQVSQVTEQDSAGNLTVITTYAYNTLGKLTQIVQGSQTRTFAYDSLGRLTSETHPEGGTTTSTYDDNSNVASKTDARGVITTNEYDALNRVTKTRYSDSTLWSFFYYDETSTTLIAAITNGKGRRTSAWTLNSTGQVVAESVGYSWSSDAAGRVVQQVARTDNTSYPVTYNYTASGCGCPAKDLQSLTYPGNFQVNYTRDSIGRVFSISKPNALSDTNSDWYVRNDPVNLVDPDGRQERCPPSDENCVEVTGSLDPVWHVWWRFGGGGGDPGRLLQPFRLIDSGLSGGVIPVVQKGKQLLQNRLNRKNMNQATPCRDFLEALISRLGSQLPTGFSVDQLIENIVNAQKQVTVLGKGHYEHV